MIQYQLFELETTFLLALEIYKKKKKKKEKEKKETSTK